MNRTNSGIVEHKPNEQMNPKPNLRTRCYGWRLLDSAKNFLNYLGNISFTKRLSLSNLRRDVFPGARDDVRGTCTLRICSLLPLTHGEDSSASDPSWSWSRIHPCVWTSSPSSDTPWNNIAPNHKQSIAWTRTFSSPVVHSSSENTIEALIWVETSGTSRPETYWPYERQPCRQVKKLKLLSRSH